MKIMNIYKQILAGAALALLTFNVMALPSVTGTMEMTGAFHAIDANGARTSDASSAVSIDFDFFGYNKFRTTYGDGDFTGLEGQLGDIQDFQFAPFDAPIAAFWSISIFSFELTDITRLPSNDPSTFLALDGTGIISAAGFEDTVASWSFSGDTSGGGIFSWSATSAVNAVPEPAMLPLLSVGLIAGLISIGLRKRQ